MAGNDDKVRARARLTWRAERAFGLEAVAVRVSAAAVDVIVDDCSAKPQAAEIAPLPRPVAAAPLVKATSTAVTTGGKVPKLIVPLPPPFTSAVGTAEEKSITLTQLDVGFVKGCTRCGLSASRTQTVFGEGDVDAPIMFIGEGPGENEDLSGRPFVGRAGELLDRMITNGMGLRRDQVYICNIVKCRPPGNRAPMPDETAACTPYLVKQIETIRPKVIVTLGAPAAKYILQNDKLSITGIRGTWHAYRGIKVMPTFHPAYILRKYTTEVRGQVWDDLKAVMHELGLPVQKRGA